MISDEEIKKYGIKSVSSIAEGFFKPRIIITHIDDSEYIYDTDRNICFDLIENIIKRHIDIVCLKQIRKKKLTGLYEIR